MIRSLFSIYGLLVAGWVGYSQWSGWSIDRVNELKNVPKSIRDNPGAWRSHYGGVGRYYGGK
ncbi:MAG: hypothetical protein JST93_37040 [Acidobacteria bacterium]|nr:hypothetical protein [Acidobacteriota bacterium]